MDVSISVITPAYNAGRFISQLLDSLHNQEEVKCHDYEVVIVNDGSTDDTQNIVEEYMTVHSEMYIKLVNQDNRGVSAARNAGLRNAKGRFIWFVDADDEITPEAMKYLIPIAKEQNIDLIKIGRCICNVLQSDGTICNYSTSPDADGFKIMDAYKLLSRNAPPYGHMGFIWRREFLLLNDLGYPEDMTWNEDYTFLSLALLKAGKAYVNTSFCFYLYRSLETSLSRGERDFWKTDKYLFNRIKLLSKLKEVDLPNFSNEKQKMFLDRFMFFREDTVRYLLMGGVPYPLMTYYFAKLRRMGMYPISMDMAGKGYYRFYNYEWLIVILSLLLSNKIAKKTIRFVYNLLKKHQ